MAQIMQKDHRINVLNFGQTKELSSFFDIFHSDCCSVRHCGKNLDRTDLRRLCELESFDNGFLGEKQIRSKNGTETFRNLFLGCLLPTYSFCILLETVGNEFQKSVPHFVFSYSSSVHNQSFRENGLFLIYETRKSKTPKIAL